MHESLQVSIVRIAFYLSQFSDEFIIRVLNKKKTAVHQGQAKNTIKLFVIAPFSDPDRVMTVHWFMFFLKRGRIVDKEAVLIVVRPLTIGSRDVSGQFEKFEPIWLVLNH